MLMRLEMIEVDHASARKAALASLWRRRLVWPLLEVYLDRDQLEDIRAFLQGCDVQAGQLPKDDWYDDISRQRGKSWKWCTFASVFGHCVPGRFIKYAAQLGTSVRQIIAPTIGALTADMPEELRPSLDSTDHVWRFPPQAGARRSEIKAAGMNNGHETDLRGAATHLFIKDECGFYSDFPKVEEVSEAQMLTTGGCSVYATTPPDSPGHPVAQVREGLKAIGRYVHRTIYNHPRMSAEAIEDFLERIARKNGMTLQQFKRTTMFRREFLCMHVVEATRAVCPEWTEPANPLEPDGSTWGDQFIREMERPRFYDAYDALDVGGTRDPYAWLGGFWDWSNARLVIEDETPPLFQARPETVADAVREKRRALWPLAGPMPTPDVRRSPCGTYWLPCFSVGDGAGVGAEKIQDMSGEGVDFVHAAKPSLEVRVNAVRTLAAQGKLFIHPRCVNLREQIATGLWADKFTKAEFERTQKGHLDHFAALVDMVHALDRQRCPIPRDFGRTPDYEEWRSVGNNSGNLRELDKALGGINWG